MRYLASSLGRPSEGVQLLLDHGAAANARSGSGWTPLMLAALHGYAEIIEMLLRHGADPNVFTDEEADAQEGCATRSALTLAVVNGRVEIVRLLLRYGADGHATSSDGHTALDAAEWRMRFPHKRAEMAEILGMLKEAAEVTG